MNETIKPAAAGWPAGFRVNPRVDLLPRGLIEAYRTVPSLSLIHI